MMEMISLYFTTGRGKFSSRGTLTHLMMSHLVCRFIHHPQHWYATCTDKADYHHGCQNQKENIQDRRVVPLYSLCDRNNIAVLWNDTQCFEKELYNIPRCRHCYIERDKNINHHLPAIIFAINIKHGQGNQVCKDKTH